MMHGMHIGHIGSTTPPAVAPLPAWGIRQAATNEGGSPQLALLGSPTVVGNLLIGVGFYRRGANSMPPVAWAEQSGHSYRFFSSRITNEGSSQFERGIFFYGLKVTDVNQRTIRFSTGHDCAEVPPGEIGVECDILRATLFELIPPVGYLYEDLVFLATPPTSGDNGATLNGLQVSSDSWEIPHADFGSYLIVSACAWRITGGLSPPMANLVWTPDLSKGGIFVDEGEHGLAFHFGVHPGDDTIVLQGDFAAGANSGLSMAAAAIEFSN